MDTKINFFKIGLFVVTFITLLIVFIFWLGQFSFENKKFDKYTIYFKESVAGLNIGSSIKYKGFDVGNVNEIKLNPYNQEEIEVDIFIKKDTPIKEDNYAVLGNLGITGLKYIELKGGSNGSNLLKENHQGLKIIASKTSTLASLVDTTTDITNELTQVLVQMKKLLNDENLKTISAILVKTQNSMANVEQFSSYLVNNEKKLDELLKNISTLSQSSNKSLESIDKSALAFKDASNQFLLEIKKGSFDMRDASKESFERLNIVLNSIDETLIQTQNLIEDLNQSPSDILFKQKAIKKGPGE